MDNQRSLLGSLMAKILMIPDFRYQNASTRYINA